MRTQCPHCRAVLEIEGSGTFSCYMCGGAFEFQQPAPGSPPVAVPPQPATGKRLVKSKGAGWWTLFTVIGYFLLIPFALLLLSSIVGSTMFGLQSHEKASQMQGVQLFVNCLFAGGMILGGVFVTVGRNLGRETICSNCGENVGKHARLCKTCKAELAA